MLYVFYFLVCSAATTLGAIAGIGGGVIIKPVMDALGGMSVSSISFLSGCTVLAMSIVSLLRSRGGPVKVDLRLGTFLALGGAVGGLLGKGLFDAVKTAFGSDSLVGAVQSALMVLLTLGVLVYVINKARIRTLHLRSPIACCGIGLVLGLLSSFLGIGGGPINLAVLYYFLSMDSKTAALNSIYIILFSQTASFASTVLQGRIPEFDWITLACMVAGGICGGFLGQSISKRLDNRQVDRLFRWMLVLITAISFYNLFHYASGLF